MNTYPLSILLESKFYFLSGPDYSWAEKASKSPVINVPKDQAKEIYIHAHNLNNAEELITNKNYNPPQVELPEKTAPALAQHSEPLPILEIDLKADEFQAELFFEYNEFEVAANDPRESLLDVEKWEILDRDLLKEAEAYFSLEDLGISRSNSGLTYDNKSVFEVLDTLFPLAATGWIIRGKDKRTIKNGAQPQLRVKSGIDWFDLDGNVSFGETIIPLPRVVRAFLKGQRIISLADGSIGILPAQWLEKFSPCFQWVIQARDASQPYASTMLTGCCLIHWPKKPIYKIQTVTLLNSGKNLKHSKKSKPPPLLKDCKARCVHINTNPYAGSTF